MLPHLANVKSVVRVLELLPTWVLHIQVLHSDKTKKNPQSISIDEKKGGKGKKQTMILGGRRQQFKVYRKGKEKKKCHQK